MPDVCVSRCRTVIVFVAGRVSNVPRASSTAVRIFGRPNRGRYFDTGSSTPTFPSSTSIITAVEVIGLVIDAMRKMESFCIARSRATSCLPNASW